MKTSQVPNATEGRMLTHLTSVFLLTMVETEIHLVLPLPSLTHIYTYCPYL
jgi:hypothetical protein